MDNMVKYLHKHGAILENTKVVTMHGVTGMTLLALVTRHTRWSCWTSQKTCTQREMHRVTGGTLLALVTRHTRWFCWTSQKTCTQREMHGVTGGTLLALVTSTYQVVLLDESEDLHPKGNAWSCWWDTVNSSN